MSTIHTIHPPALILAIPLPLNSTQPPQPPPPPQLNSTSPTSPTPPTSPTSPTPPLPNLPPPPQPTPPPAVFAEVVGRNSLARAVAWPRSLGIVRTLEAPGRAEGGFADSGRRRMDRGGGILLKKPAFCFSVLVFFFFLVLSCLSVLLLCVADQSCRKTKLSQRARHFFLADQNKLGFLFPWTSLEPKRASAFVGAQALFSVLWLKCSPVFLFGGETVKTRNPCLPPGSQQLSIDGQFRKSSGVLVDPFPLSLGSISSHAKPLSPPNSRGPDL